MFGSYQIPFRVERDDISIAVEERDGETLYTRRCRDETMEKVLLMGSGRFLVHPVEPMNLPKHITPHLLLELDRPVVVEPWAKKRVFLKFPVEIGLFLAAVKEIKQVDVISVNEQKYTLYGDPTSGVICRHWRSEVFSSIPESDPLREGVMELRIINESPKWVELTRGVFNGFGMKLYYSHNLVSLKAKMKIDATETAETDFEDAAIKGRMSKSQELLTLRMLTVASKNFVMESGL